jgi:hypothetical protein
VPAVRQKFHLPPCPDFRDRLYHHVGRLCECRLRGCDPRLRRLRLYEKALPIFAISTSIKSRLSEVAARARSPLTARQPYGASFASAPKADEGASNARDHEDINARACARLALVLMPLSASFGLAGCAAIEELREAFLRWVESEKVPRERKLPADDLPDAIPVMPPAKPSKKGGKQALKEPVKSARKPPQPRTVVLLPTKPPIPDSTEAATPEGTKGQSLPSPPPQRWLPSRFPKAPPPGRFSRRRAGCTPPSVVPRPRLFDDAGAVPEGGLRAGPTLDRSPEGRPRQLEIEGPASLEISPKVGDG